MTCLIQNLALKYTGLNPKCLLYNFGTKFSTELLITFELFTLCHQPQILFDYQYLMARMLDCGSSGLDSSPGCGHCIMFLGVTLDSHSASLNLNWPILTSIEILGSICVLCVASICETGFKSGFEEWLSKMCYRICSNGQFLRQHMKYKTIFSHKWPSTGRLEAHLAKSLPPSPWIQPRKVALY